MAGKATTSDASQLDPAKAVRDRYSAAAKEREAALCCPVDCWVPDGWAESGASDADTGSIDGSPMASSFFALVAAFSSLTATFFFVGSFIFAGSFFFVGSFLSDFFRPNPNTISTPYLQTFGLLMSKFETV